MAFERILGVILRIAELVFAGIVAGINGQYLHAQQGRSSWDLSRFIYTEVVAGLSILLALLWVLPFASSMVHWPIDVLMSILWFVAFGLIVHFTGNSCGYIFDWTNVGLREGGCERMKATIAFSFLSAICWLVSAIIGFIWLRKRTRTPVVDSRPAHRRRFWHGSRV